MASKLAPAFVALDDCDTTLRELERLCCVPGRSKSLGSVGRRLTKVRDSLAAVDGPQDPDGAIEHLEKIGAQVGRLQIGCCTEERLPLYAELLEGLTTVQLTVNEALGRGH